MASVLGPAIATSSAAAAVVSAAGALASVALSPELMQAVRHAAAAAALAGTRAARAAAVQLWAQPRAKRGDASAIEASMAAAFELSSLQSAMDDLRDRLIHIRDQVAESPFRLPEHELAERINETFRKVTQGHEHHLGPAWREFIADREKLIEIRDRVDEIKTISDAKPERQRLVEQLERMLDGDDVRLDDARLDDARLDDVSPSESEPPASEGPETARLHPPFHPPHLTIPSLGSTDGWRSAALGGGGARTAATEPAAAVERGRFEAEAAGVQLRVATLVVCLGASGSILVFGTALFVYGVLRRRGIRTQLRRRLGA